MRKLNYMSMALLTGILIAGSVACSTSTKSSRKPAGNADQLDCSYGDPNAPYNILFDRFGEKLDNAMMTLPTTPRQDTLSGPTIPGTMPGHITMSEVSIDYETGGYVLKILAKGHRQKNPQTGEDAVYDGTLTLQTPDPAITHSSPMKTGNSMPIHCELDVGSEG